MIEESQRLLLFERFQEAVESLGYSFVVVKDADHLVDLTEVLWGVDKWIFVISKN